MYRHYDTVAKNGSAISSEFVLKSPPYPVAKRQLKTYWYSFLLLQFDCKRKSVTFRSLAAAMCLPCVLTGEIGLLCHLAIKHTYHFPTARNAHQCLLDVSFSLSVCLYRHRLENKKVYTLLYWFSHKDKLLRFLAAEGTRKEAHWRQHQLEHIKRKKSGSHVESCQKHLRTI
jgi:hypothetical protein